jgi:uncharacterized protein YacL
MSQAYTGVERRGVAGHFSAGIDITQNKYEAHLPEPVRAVLHGEPWMLRGGLAVVAVALCWSLRPFELRGMEAVGAGLLLAAMILVIEMRLRWATPRGLLGGALGAVLGIFAAVLVTAVVSRIAGPERTKSFFEGGVLVAFAYLGAVLGSLKATERGEKKEKEESPIVAASVGAVASREAGAAAATVVATATATIPKLVDTSVLIDGRIADICEAHFLDGPLLVPEFVLHELQLVADSGDALKRQRGRRGLDVLERIRKMGGIEVRVLEHPAAPAGDVDRKLIEVAREIGAKIVTNDFNLNKVARVQGLSVLNVNQLANALKPVVMAGEPMRVLILREGKEANQGVAYLDDGTMVVVDGARRFINKNVDVTVTSVHQTAAGKMIFGRVDEKGMEAGAAAGLARGAAAGVVRGAENGGAHREMAEGEGQAS